MTGTISDRNSEFRRVLHKLSQQRPAFTRGPVAGGVSVWGEQALTLLPDEERQAGKLPGGKQALPEQPDVASRHWGWAGQFLFVGGPSVEARMRPAYRELPMPPWQDGPPDRQPAGGPRKDGWSLPGGLLSPKRPASRGTPVSQRGGPLRVWPLETRHDFHHQTSRGRKDQQPFWLSVLPQSQSERQTRRAGRNQNHPLGFPQHSLRAPPPCSTGFLPPCQLHSSSISSFSPGPW